MMENESEYKKITFIEFIYGFSSQTLIHLGYVPNPVTGKKEKDLEAARESIDIIQLLRDKTSGNLTKQEEEAIDLILHDLRMRYISEVSAGTPSQST